MISDSIKKLINFKTITNPNTYFPGLVNEHHKDLFGMKIHLNQDETDLCQSIIKHIEIDIFEIKDKNINAFTVPGVGSIKDLKIDPVKYNIDGLKYLTKNPLIFKVDPITNQINFNNDGFKILIFVNSGLIRKIKDPKDRLSVYLHEIGHWVYVNDIIRSASFQNYLEVSRSATGISFAYASLTREYLALLFSFIVTTILTYLTSLKTIQAEHDADNFVKQCGYGRNLANSLSLLTYNKKLSSLNVLEYYSKLDKILNKIQMVLFVNSHPNTADRIDRLIKESINIPYDDIIELFFELLEALKEIKTDIINLGIFNL